MFEESRGLGDSTSIDLVDKMLSKSFLDIAASSGTDR